MRGLKNPKATALARRKTPLESVRDLFEQWLADKLKTSVSSYSVDIEDFARFLKIEDTASAFVKLIERAEQDHGAANAILFAYRKDMLERPVWNSTATKRSGRPCDRHGLAPATINRRLAAIRSFVKVLRTAGRTKWTPEIPGVKHKRYRDTEGVGEEAVRLLIDHLEEQSSSAEGAVRAKALRDLAMVRVMASMALRKSSILSLDMKHIDFSGRRFHVTLKGDRARAWKSCDDLAWNATVKWIEARGHEPGPVFCSLHRAYIGKRMGPSGLNQILITRTKELNMSRRARPHGFRHTAITRALEMGLTITEVSKFADHVKIDTTMVYDDRRHSGRGISQKISDYNIPSKKDES